MNPSPSVGSKSRNRTAECDLLGIPTVTDRFIQQAIAQVLTPIYDPNSLNIAMVFVQIDEHMMR